MLFSFTIAPIEFRSGLHEKEGSSRLLERTRKRDLKLMPVLGEINLRWHESAAIYPVIRFPCQNISQSVNSVSQPLSHTSANLEIRA
jgi:hypothetical protein